MPEWPKFKLTDKDLSDIKTWALTLAPKERKWVNELLSKYEEFRSYLGNLHNDIINELA